MSIGAIMSIIINNNMVIQNAVRIQKEKSKEEEEKVKPTFQSTFNNKKRGDK